LERSIAALPTLKKSVRAMAFDRFEEALKKLNALLG
jgi:hypothetical protein